MSFVPLLYVLSLEPLLGALRAAPSLSGVHLPGGGGVCAKWLLMQMTQPCL